MLSSSVRREWHARLERKQEKYQEKPLKTNGNEMISEEELKIRLRGCYKCPMKADYRITKDNGTSLQPRVTTRVKCDILNGQWVRPMVGNEPTQCVRRIHVMDKKMKRLTVDANNVGK